MQLRHGVCLAFGLLFSAHAARAATCVKPDLIDTYPGDGATNVPTNATLTAHYDAEAEYFDGDCFGVGAATSDDSCVLLGQAGASPERVHASFDRTQGLLTVPPETSALLAGSDVTVKWPKLRGIGTASLGTGKDVHFTVGTADDTASPSFDGLTAIDWDVRRAQDDCTNSIEFRFVFDVTPGKASDDFGTDDLAVVVFQTSGGAVGSSGASEPVLTAPLPKTGDRLRVERAIDAATGHVCFSALVKDLAGHVSSGNGSNEQVCVDTTPPPFFYGCRVAPPGRARVTRSESPRTASLLAAGALLLSLRRRRRHRPSP